jgi:exodeoxyribonuclease-5
MLTEIHRQAQENPIIRLSMDIREGRPLERGDYGAARVIDRCSANPEDVVGADQVLVGLNRTRVSYNRRIRELLKFAERGPYPVANERVICLRNNRQSGLLNGGLWDVKRSKRKDDLIRLTIAPEDEGPPQKVEVHRAFFDGKESELPWEIRRRSDEFTFGYAITVHKSQGSQWSNVFLFDESASFREDSRRWLYTGVTRAAERITIVQGDR